MNDASVEQFKHDTEHKIVSPHYEYTKKETYSRVETLFNKTNSLQSW